MENEFKKWLRLDAFAASAQYFVKCVTAAVVTLSAMKATANDVYVAAEMVGMLSAVLVLQTLAAAGVKDKIVSCGKVVLVGDWVFWCAISILSYRYLEMRYFAIMVLTPLFATVRSTLYKVIINRRMSGG